MMSPTLSVVIGTLGRPSLEDAVSSVVSQLREGDELIVVRDAYDDEHDSRHVRARCEAMGPFVKYAEHDAGGHYYGGTAQSNHGFTLATGNYILSLGDDDAFVDGAFDKIRAKLEPGCVLIAQTLITWNGRIIPTNRRIERHAINGTAFVAPRESLVPVPLTGEPSADFDWIQDILTRTGCEPVWLDEVVSITGASRRNGVLANAGPAQCRGCQRILLIEDTVQGECVVCRTPKGVVPHVTTSSRPQKIAFVWPAAEISVSDVARGYHRAFKRAGHTLLDYKLHNRFKYHAAALERARGGDRSGDMGLLAREATEGIAAFVLRHEPDLVIIVSGMSFHPDGLLYLKKLGVPTTVIFTESPYDDTKQEEFAAVYPGMLCATQDERSAQRNGWVYLPPAFDPEVHRRVPASEEFACDVFMVATGWSDRQNLLETVNWAGIDFRLYGHWPGVTPSSPLFQLVRWTPNGSVLISNDVVAHAYSSSAINLNIHRDWDETGPKVGTSVNPRVMEIAACGGFLLTDYRPELERLFGAVTVPMFDPRVEGDLERQIKWWLAHPAQRRQVADQLYHAATEAVRGETFDTRVKTLFEALSARQLSMAVA